MNNESIKTSYRDILFLSAPLILSMSSHMLMQFIDAIFLSWYSANAIAAVVPAGMTTWLLTSAFVGTAGYTATFVAQYIGAGRRTRAAHTVWQGIYFSLAAGAFLALFILIAGPLFSFVGHAPHIQMMEVTYFTITCPGAVFVVLSSALAGFFIGRGRTAAVMVVHFIGFGANVFLDYLLIFGNIGFPRLGIAGAAWATVMASMIVAALFMTLFLRRDNRLDWSTWRSRSMDCGLLARLVRFGFPNGVRFSIEMLAWTVFIFFVGRIGPMELTATNIAWRINGIAFFPVIGFSQAITILVGNAQGAKRPDISRKVTCRGLAISQIWMVIMAVIFILWPHELFAMFNSGNPAHEEAYIQVASTGVILLRFVALYCLLDAFNYIFVGTLVAAGDTRWIMIVSMIMHVVFIIALLAADLWQRTLMTEWIIATVFVMVQAVIWFGRFLQGKWRSMQVIEPAVDEG
ncbi:MAG: MATE family efflux transporter [Chitinispirillaceae bacterium]|nr:MATE family efflux transporter [Chitinispirillaceae bacterium]